MNIEIYGLLLVLGGLLVMVPMLYRGAARGAKDAADDEHAAAHPYHCVEIKAGRGACGAACRLAGKRFLAAEAPAIPLAACGSGSCNCTYEHFEDRRQTVRRNAYRLSADAAFLRSGERRASRGRRATDLHPAPLAS